MKVFYLPNTADTILTYCNSKHGLYRSNEIVAFDVKQVMREEGSPIEKVHHCRIL